MEQVIRYLLTIPYYIWSSFIIVFVVMICSLIIRHKVNKLKIGDNPGKGDDRCITFVQFMNNYAEK